MNISMGDYMNLLGSQMQLEKQSEQNQLLAADVQQQNEMSLVLVGQLLSIRRLLLESEAPVDLMAEVDKIIGPEILTFVSCAGTS